MPADSPLTRRGRRAGPPRGFAPLRRKPKQLIEQPSLYEPAGGGSGAGLAVRGDRTGRGPTRPGSSGPAITDDLAQLQPAATQEASVDLETARIARRIAARLSIPRPHRDRQPRRGTGELASLLYRGGPDELDLDATLERILQHPVPEEEDDIIVRERVRTRRSVVLAVDVSGSMRGERVRTAAATVGALFGELSRDDLAVIAFWSDAALLVPLGRRRSVQRVLDQLLRIPAQGLTNVAFPLEIAARQLARVPVRDARVVLLSDCVHNAGPDPRAIAARLPRLDVLLDTSGEHDTDLARDLAQIGHGRLALAHRYQDVGPGLSRLFAA